MAHSAKSTTELALARLRQVQSDIHWQQNSPASAPASAPPPPPPQPVPPRPQPPARNNNNIQRNQYRATATAVAAGAPVSPASFHHQRQQQQQQQQPAYNQQNRNDSPLQPPRQPTFQTPFRAPLPPQDSVRRGQNSSEHQTYPQPQPPVAQYQRQRVPHPQQQQQQQQQQQYLPQYQSQSPSQQQNSLQQQQQQQQPHTAYQKALQPQQRFPQQSQQHNNRQHLLNNHPRHTNNPPNQQNTPRQQQQQQPLPVTPQSHLLLRNQNQEIPNYPPPRHASQPREPLPEQKVVAKHLENERNNRRYPKNKRRRVSVQSSAEECEQREFGSGSPASQSKDYNASCWIVVENHRVLPLAVTLQKMLEDCCTSTTSIIHDTAERGGSLLRLSGQQLMVTLLSRAEHRRDEEKVDVVAVIRESALASNRLNVYINQPNGSVDDMGMATLDEAIAFTLRAILRARRTGPRRQSIVESFTPEPPRPQAMENMQFTSSTHPLYSPPDEMPMQSGSVSRYPPQTPISDRPSRSSSVAHYPLHDAHNQRSWTPFGPTSGNGDRREPDVNSLLTPSVTNMLSKLQQQLTSTPTQAATGSVLPIADTAPQPPTAPQSHFQQNSSTTGYRSGLPSTDSVQYDPADPEPQVRQSPRNSQGAPPMHHPLPRKPYFLRNEQHTPRAIHLAPSSSSEMPSSSVVAAAYHPTLPIPTSSASSSYTPATMLPRDGSESFQQLDNLLAMLRTPQTSTSNTITTTTTINTVAHSASHINDTSYTPSSTRQSFRY